MGDQRSGTKINSYIFVIATVWGLVTGAASVALLYHDVSDRAFVIIIGINAIVNFVSVYAAFK